VGHDEARFEELHRRAFRPLSAYALRRNSPDDAADVVADTLLVVWRRLADVPPPPDDLPWLYGVARRVLANQRRATERRSVLTERLAAELTPARRAVEPAGDLARAMDALRDDQRELLRLAAWEGLTATQLGVALGCSANAAAIRLHRARAALRTALEHGERPGPARTSPSRRPTDA
jgi:RNA polymerase sigma factor (sigma-70 family)